ncbi:MAG: hypothetical protein ACFFE3_06425, partial [Candidatus Thorarchaeota archaeon]
KTRLCQIVRESKISSIEKLSNLVGAQEEEAMQALQELVSEGSLNGSFTEDGRRFFLSDIRVSSAPIVGPADLGLEIEVKDTKLAKSVFIIGLVLIVSGYIIRGLTGIDELIQNVGFGILMIGLATLIAGWMMFSRKNPPENIRV